MTGFVANATVAWARRLGGLVGRSLVRDLGNVVGVVWACTYIVAFLTASATPGHGLAWELGGVNFWAKAGVFKKRIVNNKN